MTRKERMLEEELHREKEARAKDILYEREERRAEVETIIKQNEALHQRLEELKATRAGRLIESGAEFVCIDAEEPYYLEVYRTIRQFAVQRGTWTEACERIFRQRLEQWLNRYSVKER